MSNFIILVIAIPLLTAFLLPLLKIFSKKLSNFCIGLSLILTNIISFFLYKLVLENGNIVYSVGANAPSITAPSGFPIRIILTANALSSFLALFFTIIASLTFFYSLKILKKYANLDKFYILYLLLLVGILGFLFVGDFFTLFVFYEISSISTAGLIIFLRDKENFKSTFHYLSIFSIGSLFLLLGIGLLYSQYGFLNMAIIGQKIQFSFLDKIALSFIGSALLLKVGVFPFYFWKPEAYKVSPAPAIILSILSSLSAIYVIFKIAFDVFSLNISFIIALVLLAAFSILFGNLLALAQKNLKKVIAYLAISELGYIILGISSGFLMQNSEFGFNAIKGGLFHIVNDALDVGTLSLIIGIVFYIAKTKDNALSYDNNISLPQDKVRGLAHKYPLLSISFLLVTLALSGLPPLNGFASKIIIYKSIFHLNPALTIIGILGSILTLAVLIKIFALIFLGAPNRDYQPIPKTAMVIIFIFASFMILIGLFPMQFTNYFIDPGVKALIFKPINKNNIYHLQQDNQEQNHSLIHLTNNFTY